MLPDSRGFLIVGHRGAAGLAPENTLAGFACAVRLGVDAVELDVQIADGELVVIHDPRVDRTTNGTGPVAGFAFAALRSLDAGNGARIPTLAEVLASVPEHVAVNVELKGADTAAPVAAMLAGGRRPMLVSSFDHAELMRFHALCPEVPCAPLVSRWGSDLDRLVHQLDAWSVNLADRIATAERVAKIASFGCRSLVFTVNDPARARELCSWGVAGVFTDYPDRVRRTWTPPAAGL